ncbi:MAG: hypothetical protein ACREHE_05405 [Rhizomicrobium sp.]
MKRIAFGIGAGGIACLLGMAAPSFADPAAAPYPNRAPIAQYMMASPAEEIALARSAAPPSISDDAEILVLGPDGYKTAVKGKNGFVCLVERAWDADFVNPIFWDPDNRGPDCLNPAAARTILPHFLERTKWALAGLSIPEMLARTKAELAAKTYVLPEPGAIAYMMSKDQKLGPQSTHWHPHLMFFVANTSDADWGANLAGSPILHPFASDPEPTSTFLVPVGRWSDGTPFAMDMK